MSDTTAAAPEAPVVIRIEDVSKRFVIRKDKSVKERIVNFGRGRRFRSEFWALRDVAVEVRAGTTIGLIGANGSGKSTLLKVIGGIIQPTGGRILRRGRLAALLELGAGFHPDLTGRENIYLNASILGLTRAQTDEYFDSIVDFSEIPDFIDTQVKFYSSGMYVRLAFAIAVHVDPDILLVDEVLAVGDEAFQRKCMDKIREYQRAGKTIVFVSHSFAQVSELCDSVIVMRKGRVEYQGDTAAGIQLLRDEFADRSVPLGAGGPSRPDGALRGVEVTAGENGTIRPGGKVEIAIDVEMEPGAAASRISLDIESPAGIVVWSSVSDILGRDGDGAAGRLAVHLDDVRLGDGVYTVSVALVSEVHGQVAHMGQAGRFSIFGATGGAGIVQIPADAVFSARGPSREATE